jgi:hypothetical protein
MTKSDVQTSLRLPEALRTSLSVAAEKNGHGIGEEMRQRLEASFEIIPTTEDDATRWLLAAIAEAAVIINDHCAGWLGNPFAFTVMKSAVEALLAHCQPEGEPVRPVFTPNSSGDRIFGRKTPEEAGVTLAGIVQVLKSTIFPVSKS